MVLGLVVPERKHWFHVDFWLIIGGRIDASEGIDVYNVHKHRKWYIDG